MNENMSLNDLRSMSTKQLTEIAMCDAWYRFRAMAVLTLGGRREEAAIQALIHALGDESKLVRDSAKTAIEMSAQVELVETDVGIAHLETAAVFNIYVKQEENPEARKEALTFAVKSDHIDGTDACIHCLRDTDVEVRRTAAKNLKHGNFVFRKTINTVFNVMTQRLLDPEEDFIVRSFAAEAVANTALLWGEFEYSRILEAMETFTTAARQYEKGVPHSEMEHRTVLRSIGQSMAKIALRLEEAQLRNDL